MINGNRESRDRYPSRSDAVTVARNFPRFRELREASYTAKKKNHESWQKTSVA